MRLIRLTAAIGLALMTLGAAAAPAGAAPKTKVISVTGCECVGDTIKGVLHAAGKAGDTITLTLYAKEKKISSWAPTGLTTTVTLPADSNGSTGHMFEFNIAGLNDYSYIVEATAAGASRYSNVVKAKTCAPPTEVPEAPAALLLPISLLGTVAVGSWLWRRRQASTVTIDQ